MSEPFEALLDARGKQDKLKFRPTKMGTCCHPPSRVLRGGYLVADCIVNQPREGMKAELEHDFRPVGLDSPDSDSQQRRDFLIRFPFGQEADDFCLPGSCSGTDPLPLLALASFLEKSLQHDFGYFRSEEPLAVRNGFDGFDEALREIGFQKIPVSPCFQCTLHHLV